MELKAPMNLQGARGQLGIDTEWLVIRGREEHGGAKALFISDQERGRRAVAQAANGAAAMHLAGRGTHDAQEAFGVDELSNEGGLSQGNHLGKLFPGASHDFE